VDSAPVVFVIAGVNGAGKSSLGGGALRRKGLNYFDPDEVAARIRRELGCSVDDANGRAWNEGKRRLESAIRLRESYAFETTLGGNTIPRLIRDAALAGFDVRVWFIGLATPKQHIARVRARVAAGGHDIPEAKIRERWEGSRRNIIMLMNQLAELRLFDNSEESEHPAPKLLLHLEHGQIVAMIQTSPDWAKPIIDAALNR